MVRKLDPEKRTQYLRSALKLFVENGISQTPTAVIAEDAGTAAGTLFLYFPTKQDLIDGLVMEIVQEQSDAINNILQPGQSAQSMFFTIWEGTIRWFLENKDAYAYILQVRDSGMISESAVQETEKFFQFYYMAIELGLSEGSIRSYPTELVGNLLYHNIMAVMDLVRALPDPDRREDYIQTGFEIFWNGIKSESK
ncbi:MAG: TetR/AcrR family transcriptional regulator [Anaerolineales bacterium]|jgi:AcrR family transcriptional regulator